MGQLMGSEYDALPAVEILSDRVVRVLGSNPGPYTLQGTNTYLVGTGHRRILIDTGENSNHKYIRQLRKTLDDLDAEISLIIVTHHHRDHVGGANDVIKQLMIGQPDQDKRIHKIRAADGKDDETLAPCGYRYVYDGEVLKTEGATLKVMATPGHTDDHMALLLVEENILFSGDCILGHTTPVFEDMKAYKSSMRKLQAIRPKKIYPGHGDVIQNGELKISQGLRHIDRRARLILDALKQRDARVRGLTTQEITERLYTGISMVLKPGAMIIIQNHLAQLAADELVHRQASNRWVIA